MAIQFSFSFTAVTLNEAKTSLNVQGTYTLNSVIGDYYTGTSDDKYLKVYLCNRSGAELGPGYELSVMPMIVTNGTININLDVSGIATGSEVVVRSALEYTDISGITAYDFGYFEDITNSFSTSAVIGSIKNGVLYNWFAATYNTGGASIAPAGWHVPTNAELTTLYTYLGADESVGGKLKETGTVYWDSPNTGATNSSGYLGRGAGYRNAATGSFAEIKKSLYLWATNQSGANGYTWYIVNDYAEFFGDLADKNQGSSIRLIKDDSTDPGTVTDYDGNVYQTVKIGSQVWMAENLAVKHYNDGTTITEVTDNTAWAALTTGALCAYDNDWDNVGGYVAPAETSAYNQEYNIEFTSKNGLHEFVIRIMRLNYSGAVKTRATSVEIEMPQDLEDRVNSVSLNLPIRALVDFEFFDFNSIDARMRKVEVWRDNALYWTGFMVPNQHSEIFKTPPYWVNIYAVDGIRLLKFKDFEPDGLQTAITTIAKILKSTGLSLPISVACTILPTNNGVHTAFDSCKFNEEAFAGQTSYEVLNVLLSRFNCFITQFNGVWNIYRIADLTATRYNYDADGVYTGSSDAPAVLDLGSASADPDVKVINVLTASLTETLSKISYKTNHGYKKSIVPNYLFADTELSGGRLVPSDWTVSPSASAISMIKKGDGYCVKFYDQDSTATDYIKTTFPVIESDDNAVFAFDFGAMFKKMAPSSAVIQKEYAEAGKICVMVKLSDGTTTNYLNTTGWQTGSVVLKTEDITAYTNAENLQTYKIDMGSIPFSGTLEITLYQLESALTYSSSPATGVRLSALFTNIRFYFAEDEDSEPEESHTTEIKKVDEIASLVDSREFQIGDVPTYGDNPSIFNAALFDPTGALITEWTVYSKTIDEMLVTDSVIENSAPQIKLNGTLKGLHLNFCSMMLHDYGIGYTYFVKRANYLLYENVFTGDFYAYPYSNLPAIGGFNACYLLMTDNQIIDIRSNANTPYDPATGKIQFPTFSPDIFDKTNTTYWETEITGTAYYNASNPREWNIAEFKSSYLDPFTKEAVDRRLFYRDYIIGYPSSILPIFVEYSAKTDGQIDIYEDYYNQ